MGDVAHLARGHRRRTYILGSGETHLVAVAGALAVNGIGTHIIFRVLGEAGHVADESACAFAARGMAAAGCRVMARAPADAALRHRRATIVGHIAAALCSGLGDVAHFIGRHRGHIGGGAERNFVAVRGTHAVLGVCTNVIGSARIKSSKLNAETASTSAAGGMGAFYGGAVFGAPADAALRHWCAAVVGHFAVGRSAFHGTCRHSGRADILGCGKLHLFTV